MCVNSTLRKTLGEVILLNGERSLTSHSEYPAKYYLQFLFTFKLRITKQQTVLEPAFNSVAFYSKTYKRKREKTWTFPASLLAVVCVHVLERTQEKKNIEYTKLICHLFFEILARGVAC